MVGAAVAEQLSHGARPSCAGGGSTRDGGVRFVVGSVEHDGRIRRLLRESPMPGRISLSLEREPGFFAAAAIEGPEHWALVGLRNEQVICAGTASARTRFINGRPMRIGYLGGLRLHASFRGQAAILRRGYEFFRKNIHALGGPPIYLTSIIADNLRARRLLEANLAPMPTYRWAGDYVTIAIECRRRRARRQNAAILRGTPDSISDMLERINQDHQQYQFASWMSEQDVHLPGIAPADFCAAMTPGGGIGACAAVWDQRAAKQAVVRGYRGPLRYMRPWINALAPMLGKPRLPAPGKPLNHAFIAHFAAGAECGPAAEVIEACCQAAGARGIDYLVLGFDARDPRLSFFRRTCRPREYLSKIYIVHWADGAELAQSLDGRLLAPEVALL